MEECALDMEQRANYAAMMDAQIWPKKEDCALGMEQRSNDAELKDAQVLLKREECAVGMGQRSNINNAAVKDAQTIS